MDIVSYGIGNKSAKEEAKLRKDILGTGVEGSHPHVRARIDSLEDAIEGVNSLANKLIINDAVNIMKAHAKLNAIAKTTKYKMHNMIFDDLLDLSGIDTSKSSGYTHDSVSGSLTAGDNCVVKTKSEVLDVPPTKAILVEDSAYYVSDTIPAKQLLENQQLLLTSSLGNAAAIFDEDASTTWSVKSPTGWIRYQFNTACVINSYDILARFSTVDYHVKQTPKNWTFEGSQDGTTWEVLDTQTNITWSLKQTKTFNFSNNTPYYFYRMNITANNGDNYTTITEMKLKGVSQSFNSPDYSISRDNGTTWESILPNTLFYFTDSISPLDNKLCLKAKLPSGTKLLNYALTWA